MTEDKRALADKKGIGFCIPKYLTLTDNIIQKRLLLSVSSALQKHLIKNDILSTDHSFCLV